MGRMFVFAVLITAGVFMAGCGGEKGIFADADGLRQDGMYEEAVEGLRGIVEKYPASPDTVTAAFRRMGSIYLEELNQYDKAMEAFNQISSRYPDSPVLAEIATETIKYLEKIPARKPDDQQEIIRIYRVIGDLQAGYLGKFDKACETYQKVVDQYPEDPVAPLLEFQIGYTYANHLGDLEKAKTHYEQFLSKYPKHELAASVEAELEMMKLKATGLSDEDALNEFLKQKTK